MKKYILHIVSTVQPAVEREFSDEVKALAAFESEPLTRYVWCIKLYKCELRNNRWVKTCIKDK